MAKHNHYQQAALEELDAMRTCLDAAARRWAHTLVLEQADADELQAIMSHVDLEALDSVNRIILKSQPMIQQ